MKTLLVWLALVSTAYAHPTPGSVAYLDFTVDGARLEQDVPIEELERALKRQLAFEGDTPAQMVDRDRALLMSYAPQHLSVTSDGAPWAVQLLDVEGHEAHDGPRARFRFALTAPDAGQSFALHDEIVAHEVVSHYLTVYVRSEWGVQRDEPQLVGVIHAGHHDLTVTRAGGFWPGFGSVVTMGIEHITTGTDHLLFLFALVLVAPVIGPRWRLRRDMRSTATTLAAVVSAFTVGHSLTLALGALGWVRLPSAAIEAAIAASVLITALHALRPLFPGREAWVAGAFGLVHGLAFADTLADRQLGTAQAVWTLLGFNLGIELAQLGLLLVTVPWLLVLARTRSYDALRTACGLAIAVFAGGWMIERMAGRANPTEVAVLWLQTHALFLLLGLAGTALIARASELRR